MASSQDQEPDGCPVSSLIDVVFLLIMFFVATAKMDQEGFDQNVKLAIAVHMEKITKRANSQFPVSVKADGSVSTGAGSDGTVQGLKNELIRHVAKYGNEVTVIIRADKEAQLSVIEKVMNAVTESGVSSMKISAKLEEK